MAHQRLQVHIFFGFAVSTWADRLSTLELISLLVVNSYNAGVPLIAWVELEEMFLQVSNVGVGLITESAAVGLQLVVSPKVVLQIATFKELFPAVLVGASEPQYVFLLLMAELFGHLEPVFRDALEGASNVWEVLTVVLGPAVARGL